MQGETSMYARELCTGGAGGGRGVTTKPAASVETMVRIPSTPSAWPPSVDEGRTGAEGETTPKGTMSRGANPTAEDANNELGIDCRAVQIESSIHARESTTGRANEGRVVTTLPAANMETMVGIPSTPSDCPSPMNRHGTGTKGETSTAGTMSVVAIPPVEVTNNE